MKSSTAMLFSRTSNAPTNQSKIKPNSAEGKFLYKLYEGDLDDFSAVDWKRYIQMKCKEQGILFVSSPQVVASILKSCVANYGSQEIKGMIDFIFDSKQTVFDYTSNPVMALSKSWLSFTYNNSKKWLSGTYQDKNIPVADAKPRESKLKRKAKTDSINLGGGISI